MEDVELVEVLLMILGDGGGGIIFAVGGIYAEGIEGDENGVQVDNSGDRERDEVIWVLLEVREMSEVVVEVVQVEQ